MLTSSDRGVRNPLQPGDPTKCMHFAGSPIRAFLPRGVAARTRLARRRCLRRLSVARLLLFPFRIFIRRGPRGTSLLASCGTNDTSLQDFISRTHITKRMTALTEYPAREEEFGTRAQVLPLLSCALALGTQIVAALRLRIRLRKRDIVIKRVLSKCTLNRLRKSARKFSSERVSVVFIQHFLGVSSKQNNFYIPNSTGAHFAPTPAKP